jgi:alkyl hydroperoxide reductase subunit AhpC
VCVQRAHPSLPSIILTPHPTNSKYLVFFFYPLDFTFVWCARLAD